MANSRSSVVSSFTIIKGSLIDETYAAFQSWDLEQDKQSNLRRIKERNVLGAKSAHWLRDVAFVLSRRFDPLGGAAGRSSSSPLPTATGTSGSRCSSSI